MKFENRACTDAQKEVVALILAAWKKSPHLRLGQMLGYAAGDRILFIEDYELVDVAEELAGLT